MRIDDPAFLAKKPILRSLARTRAKRDKGRIDKTGLAFAQNPPERNGAYRKWIASLPCCICGRTDVQCAHIRGNDSGTGMRPTDMGRTVPLCVHHHNDGSKECQHNFPGGEMAFWEHHRVDVLKLAHRLKEIYIATRDQTTATMAIIEARK